MAWSYLNILQISAELDQAQQLGQFRNAQKAKHLVRAVVLGAAFVVIALCGHEQQIDRERRDAIEDERTLQVLLACQPTIQWCAVANLQLGGVGYHAGKGP